MRTNTEEIQIEETIRLIKADLRRIEDNQYGTITSDVRRTLQQIEETLETRRLDRRTIGITIDKLSELKQEIKSECNQKGDAKVESITQCLKDYKRGEASTREEEQKLQGTTLGKIQEERADKHNNISMEYIESAIAEKLSNVRSALARAGVSDRIIDDINMENKYIMRGLVAKIGETVNMSERRIDETLEMGVNDIFKKAIKQKDMQENKLDASGIFEKAEPKSWELTEEEESKFKEGEKKALEKMASMPEKAPEKEALDSRDIF